MDIYKFSRTPGRRGGIRPLLKVTGERKAENRLSISTVLTGEIFKRPSLILPPSCLERHPYSTLRRTSPALLEPFPCIDHQYCPRKITISSSARSSIGHGRHMPPHILRIASLGEKSKLLLPIFPLVRASLNCINRRPIESPCTFSSFPLSFLIYAHYENYAIFFFSNRCN